MKDIYIYIYIYREREKKRKRKRECMGWRERQETKLEGKVNKKCDPEKGDWSIEILSEIEESEIYIYIYIYSTI